MEDEEIEGLNSNNEVIDTRDERVQADNSHNDAIQAATRQIRSQVPVLEPITPVELPKDITQDNIDFLFSTQFLADYYDAIKLLREDRQTKGMPSLGDCIKSIASKGNKALDTMRKLGKDVKLMIVVIVGEDNEIDGYRPCLINGSPYVEPLKDSRSMGEIYNAEQSRLKQDGLRLADYVEHCMLFRMIRLLPSKKISIDRETLKNAPINVLIYNGKNRINRRHSLLIAEPNLSSPDNVHLLRQKHFNDQSPSALIARAVLQGDIIPPQQR